MVVKLDYYRIFLQVGKSESFSKAAKSLYMTQPAISQAIAHLETELGSRLFNRTTKGVNLTDEGNILFGHVKSALELIEVGENKLLEFKHLTLGELKIGVGDTISKYYLLPYLEDFRNRFPNIHFKIVNGTTTELTTQVKSGAIDIAVCNLPLDDHALTIHKIKEIHDIFVCGIKYKPLITQPLSYDRLVKLPLIMLERLSNSRNYVEDFLNEQGIRIAPELELGSHDLLIEFAKSNLGVACVIKEFSYEYLTRGTLFEIPLEIVIPPRFIGVCYLENVPLTPSSTRFVQMLLSK
ncbi:LysR family transcriptional regulator [Kurthia sibirica]|uniref:LysR family transcriptional regulator n=1 Tax=Kurthia sibirica TaxID=202750 RepID=A0A2U3AME8_9BACL|nr:LysR family transcriptional regulator [Kurthia sibirica]PWI25695.1 LysR family transcriptional regulator [Kurthia sibirica]GEK33700.1 LysR family transcriptional regulator [Kurthia sibirica]